MDALWLGIALAVLASALFNVGIGLQAIEARRTPPEESLRPSLLVRLLGRKRWLLGLGLGAIGAGIEIAAFANAPFVVVESLLAVGLLLLLAMGRRELGETIGWPVLCGVFAIIAGTALIAWGAPPHSEAHRGAGSLTLVMIGLGAASLAPFVLRLRGLNSAMLDNLASACGFAATNIAAKLMADDIGGGHFGPAAMWLAVAVAGGVLATLTGMSALQRLPASRAVPISTAVQTFLPVLLGPFLFEEHWQAAELDGAIFAIGLAVMAVGTILVARSRTVAALVAAEPEPATRRPEAAAARRRRAPGSAPVAGSRG